MNMKPDDRISNVDVLRSAGLESVESVLAATQLRWFGHIARMKDSRIPKHILNGELAQGSRKVGGQKLRYKDVAKRDIKAMDLDVSSWGRQAADRSGWHSSL